MKRLRFLLVFVLTAIAAQSFLVDTVTAQQADADHVVYTCGSDWARHIDYDALLETTRQNNPALFTQMVARAKGTQGPEVAGGETFYVISQTGQGIQSVEATLIGAGNDVNVWLADTYNGALSQTTIDKIVVGLEDHVKDGISTRNPNKGVIENDIDIFGEPIVDKASAGAVKVHILLLDIESPIDGGVIEGYFSPYDQTTRVGSNQRNLLYVDLKSLISDPQNAVDAVLGTIAHEFQHLINYSRFRGASDDTHWMYNEGLSEVASIRNGYHDRDAKNYLNVANQYDYFDAPAGETDANIILRGYERAMLWIHYLSERFGDEFLYDLVASTGSGIEPVRAAMQKSQLGSDVEKVMSEFWTANYLQGTEFFQGDAVYQYSFPVSSASAKTYARVTPVATIKMDSLTLPAYGAYYPRYGNNDPEGISIAFRFMSGARPYGVHAILFRPDKSIDVQPMNLDQDYVFGNFTNVIFAVADLSGAGQQVLWRAGNSLLGVEEYATVGTALSLAAVAPNPVRDEVRFGFRTASSGPVTLDLFSMGGELVRRVLQAKIYERGEHSVTADLSELPAGVYTARLADGSGAVSVRQVIVAK